MIAGPVQRRCRRASEEGVALLMMVMIHQTMMGMDPDPHRRIYSPRDQCLPDHQ